MDSFEKRYGIIETKIKELHRDRRMFAIVKDKLEIAEPRVEDSHAVWFAKEGWIGNKDDPEFKTIVRGNVSKDGEIYFYIDYDFQVTKESEDIFFRHLLELVERLKVKPNSIIGGGLNQGIPGEQWLPQKIYGTVEEVLKKD